ncbi:hypothetical protein BDW59DRAFT_155921 [Aspergillus cavernicola]|uniref:Uncharacterized protein n=1 Tax=Aspergillus cavernicola TaxID=176166 RepID=A0ABR4J5M6_9EURO
MASSPPASPGRSRGFSSSGRSDKSHRSSGSGNKLHLTETAEEKARRNLHTKADPMLAMSEAQPNLVALEKSTLASLRALQHKDQFGNPITEPDLSNPTRPRFERPLDTIRSFEAAIYGPYSSRSGSYARTAEESNPGADYSRRSSYYNGYSNGQHNDRGGHHSGRPNYSRPNSYVDNGNGYHNGGGPPEPYPYNNQNGGRSRPRQYPRGYSDQSSHANPQSGYPQTGHAQNGHYRSSDNVTVASPSGPGSSPDQWGNSTDPSSINSSLDQYQQQQQQQEGATAETYGFQGFGPGPNIGDQELSSNAAGMAAYGQAPAPAQASDPNMGGPVGGAPLVAGRRHLQRKTLQQSASSDAGDNNTKRKSWFKRTFTKN